MIFFKLSDPFRKTIDGTEYQFTNNAVNDTHNCKEQLVLIYDKMDPMNMQAPELDHENLNTWKKDLIKLLKEWDKLYLKHVKSCYPEMVKVHQ